VEARQAAAIAVKNLVKRTWEDDAIFGSAPDRAAARAAVLGALLRPDCTGAVREQFAECVGQLVFKDFPDRWPELLPTTVAAIRGRSDAVVVHNALLALRKVAKRFEFKARDDDARSPVEAVVAETFPLLRPLLATLTPSAGSHPEAALLAKLVLKIFWSCTQFALPRSALHDPAVVLEWFELIKAVLECDAPAPQDAAAEDDQAEAQPAWKLKKWAAQIATRFLTRYGRPKFAEEACKPFARRFSAEVAPRLLEAMLGLLAASSRGRWVSRRVRQLAFAYVDSAVEVGGLYKLLKPHLEFVLFDCALPTLCATPADLRRFRDDPQEYVRRAHDPMEDFFDPRAAATSLVADLVRCRSKAVLEPLLGRLAGALDAYAAAPTVDAARRKDGALCALGAISDELQSRAPLQPHVEALLAGHVLPELEGAEPFGQHGLLRCRACWALQRFAEHPGLARPDRAPRVAAAVLRALGDADLPVRVEATSALRHLLASDVGGFDEILRPELPRLLDACFRVMREAASDDVVQALEIVVDRYGKDVAPYAVALAQRLGEAFGAYAAAADDDEEASMAAAQCVEAMAATLASLDDNDDNVYGKVEPHLAPVLARIFEASGDFIEYFENGVEVLSYLTYNGAAPFSDALWGLFDRLLAAFHGWAYDYLPDLVAPLDNFVSRDTRRFLTGASASGEPHLAALARVPERLLLPEHLARAGERDAVKATHLLLSILHNCRGEVDVYARTRCAPLVAASLGTALGPAPADSAAAAVKSPGQPEQPWRPKVGLALLDVWNSLLFYDAALAVAALDDAAAIPPESARGLLQKWVELAPDAAPGLGRKLAALGLSSALSLSPPPPRLAAARPALLAALVAVLGKCRSQDADDGDDDEDDFAVADADDIENSEEEEEEDDDDDDDAEQVDAAALGSGAGQSQLEQLRSQLAAFADGDDWLDDDGGDDEWYQSPIDEEDEFRHFLNALHASRSLGDFDQLCASLGDAGRAQLQELGRHAEDPARLQKRNAETAAGNGA